MAGVVAQLVRRRTASPAHAGPAFASTGGALGPDLLRALQSAELALVTGQPARAAEVLSAAYRRFPRTPELAELLGELALERGDSPAALGFLQEALKLSPENLNVLEALERADMGLGHAAAADAAGAESEDHRR